MTLKISEGYLFPALHPVLKNLSGADILQTAVAFFLWVALVLLASLPAFAPRKWPLAGPGWNIRRLQGVFIILLIAAFVVWRAPELRFNAPYYDPDESQFLSVAQRFTTDPVAWRSADAGSSGPLNCYILTWPALFGLPLNYVTARLTGLACRLVTLVFLLRSVSLIIGRRRAPLIVLAIATFYFLTWHWHFVPYLSEHLPVALLSASGWFLLALWRKPTWTSALALGICLGAVPFTKLQAAPIAVYLFAVALALVLLRPTNSFAAPAARLPILLALAGGGLLVPALVLTPVIATGSWPDFMQRYILYGIRYRPEMLYHDEQSHFQIALLFIKNTAWGLLLLNFSAGLILIKLLFHFGRFDRTWLTGLALIGGYLGVTVFAILKPQMPFAHYSLLLPCPLLLFVAWLVRGIRPHSVILARISTALPLLFLLACIIPQWIPFARHFHDRLQLSDRPPPDPVIPAIRAVSQPGDTLAIWGWAPEYYVQTGLHPAGRDVVVMPGRDADYYRGTYLSDIERARPRVFIDVVGTGYDIYPEAWPHPVESARYTMFPPLAAYIDSHYYLQSKIASPTGGLPVLIFVRTN